MEEEEYKHVDEELEKIISSLEATVPSFNPSKDVNQLPPAPGDEFLSFLLTEQPPPPAMLALPILQPPTNIITSPIPSRVPYNPTPVINENPEPPSNDNDVPTVPVVTSSIPRHPYIGELGFRALVETVDAKWKFEISETDKLLFVKLNTSVPIEFRSFDPLPKCALVRATVIHQDPVQLVSQVKNKNSSRFMESHLSTQELSSYLHHDCIMFKVAELPCNADNVPYGIVKFTCTSSQVKGAPHKKSLNLLLIFQLLIDNQEESVDVFQLKVCSCVSRDYKRFLSSRQPTTPSSLIATPPSQIAMPPTRITTPPSPKKFKASDSEDVHDGNTSVLELTSINPRLNLTNGIEPNDKGEYTFTWTGKDKGLLNLFLILEKGHNLR